MIALLPQHGRSNRLPGKGIKEFCGLPLVAWSVIQAKAAHSVTDVYVSTESREVAEICEPHGAKIIWRPDWMNDKRFAANVPFKHMIETLGLDDSEEGLLFMLATSPLKKPGDIDRLYKLYQDTPKAPEGIAKQCLMAATTQEAVVWKHYNDHAGHKRGRMIFGDKSHETINHFGGLNVTEAKGYMKAQIVQKWILDAEHVTDAAADADLVFHSSVNGNPLFYYIDCELWQTAEIDDAQGFKLCEILMESQILKGRGAEVYYEYARTRKS